MAKVKHATSVQGADEPGKSVNANEWNEDHFLSGVADQTAVDALSDAVSALADRVSANSGTGGSGSVTSAEVVNGDNAVSAQAASALSQALSALSVTDAGLSSRINTVSNAASIVSVALASEVSNRISADNALSNAISALSQQLSLQVSALSQAHSVLSAAHVSLVNRVSANSGTGGAGSVTSAEVVAGDDAVSAQAASALSQALSVLSVADAALSTRLDSAANVASALSIRADSLANAISVVSNALSNEISNRVSADNALSTAISAVSQQLSLRASVLSHAISVEVSNRQSADNALSGRIDSVANGVSVVSNAASNALSVGNKALSLISTVSAHESAGGTSIRGLQAVINALSQRISVEAPVGGGGGSVTSAEVAAGDASVASVMSNRIDSVWGIVSNALSAGDVVSNRISALIPWLAAVKRIVSDVQSTNGSAMVDVSGMVLTVAAGETWKIQGQAAFSTSAANAGLKLGWSVAPLSTPRFGRFNGGSAGQSAAGVVGGGQVQVSGSSVLYSQVSTVPAGGVIPVIFDFIMNVASAGTIRLQFAGMASTAQSPMHVLPGTHMICFRLK